MRGFSVSGVPVYPNPALGLQITDSLVWFCFRINSEEGGEEEGPPSRGGGGHGVLAVRLRMWGGIGEIINIIFLHVGRSNAERSHSHYLLMKH